MADTRQRTTLGSRFRFLVRALGLTGLAVVVTGVALAVASFPSVDLNSWAGWKTIPNVLGAATKGAHGSLAQGAAWALVAGLAAVVLALLVDVVGLLAGASGRAAAGTTATVGAVAAIVLLVLVNCYSFTHSGRYDCTRDQRFTLPPELAADLSKIRAAAPTTIVVHQTHNFGRLAPHRDSYTKAAEEKVTEKVRDLVDRFREFGPQFKVVVLDTEAFGYKDQLDALTTDAPELKTAIEADPENGIFFHANKRVQRLSFNEFMQLDKTASKEADGGRANLVLLPQGIDAFARRVLAVQERRPKVAVCVVHEALGTTRGDGWRARYGMVGLRKALTDAGFDVTDIVLKKWGTPGGPKPAADTAEESTLERLEAELRSANATLRSARAERNVRDADTKKIAEAKGKPWAERVLAYSDYVVGTPPEDFEPQILEVVEKLTKRARERFTEAERNQKELEKRLVENLKDERHLQYRRMTDVSAKLTKQLADVDLLIVSRFTTEDALEGQEIDPELHSLSAEQAQVAKEFMKQGKPVLACLGPISPQFAPEQGESLPEFNARVNKELSTSLTAQPEELEKLLTDRGIVLGRTVVLFDGETKSLTSDRFGSGPVEVPPLTFTESPAADAKLKPNPIANAVRLTGRTAENALELRFRAVRPVSLTPAAQARQPFAAELVQTAPNSWNELRPFPLILPRGQRRILVYAPEFDPPAKGDAGKGTSDEEKRGPFTIGVAVENKIPASWVYEDYESRQLAAVLNPFDTAAALGLMQAAEHGDRPTQRTVVFGSGHVFGGPELKPAQEKLLLHTVNWLTAREDRLPKSELPAWQYPRVAMSESEKTLWRWGAAVGMPLVAAYAGLLAMMRRRMR